MQMLYNSDSFVVVQIDMPAEGEVQPRLGGYEIVDKFARKGIFLEGAVAATFKSGVDALMENTPTEELLDDYIGGFTVLAQQTLALH